MAALAGGTAAALYILGGKSRNRAIHNRMLELWKDRTKAPGPQWNKIKRSIGDVGFEKAALEKAKEVWKLHETDLKKGKGGITRPNPKTFSTNPKDQAYLSFEGSEVQFDRNLNYKPGGQWYPLSIELGGKRQQLTPNQVRTTYYKEKGLKLPKDLTKRAGAENLVINQDDKNKSDNTEENQTSIKGQGGLEFKPKEGVSNKVEDVVPNQSTGDKRGPASNQEQRLGWSTVFTIDPKTGEPVGVMSNADRMAFEKKNYDNQKAQTSFPGWKGSTPSGIERTVARDLRIKNKNWQVQPKVMSK